MGITDFFSWLWGLITWVLCCGGPKVDDEARGSLGDAGFGQDYGAMEEGGEGSAGPPDETARFFTKLEGEWRLDGKSGSYKFNVATRRLQDGDSGEELGTFACAAIGGPPFGAKVDEAGKEVIPSIAVVASEVMKAIGDPNNAGHYFVLPSQLNGAEYPDENDIVEELADYKHDNTGGPRGQLAVHPAAGQFILDNALNSSREEGIVAVDQILSACQAAGVDIRLQNGYLAIGDAYATKKGDEATATIKHVVDNLHTLRPLVMHDVKACGLVPSKREHSTAEHKVNLVYASAVPVDAYLNGAGEVVNRVAASILVAQYYGAMKVAARRAAQKSTIWLMPLGGGVFNNSWDSIAKGMSLAVELLTEEERAKLDIRALTWEGSLTEKTRLVDLLGRLNKLREIA